MFCSLCSSWEPCGKKGCWIAEDGWEHRKAKEAGLLRGNAPRKEGVFQVLVRPMNCDSSLGTKDRCPHCHQFHLRPGYCQALDPVNKPDAVNTEPVNKPTVVNMPVNRPEPEVEPAEEVIDATEKRRRYMKAYMARRREESK